MTPSRLPGHDAPRPSLQHFHYITLLCLWKFLGVAAATALPGAKVFRNGPPTLHLSYFFGYPTVCARMIF